MNQDPYQILGINRDASLEDVNKAYKKAARKAHPDQGGTNEEFHRVQAAYDLLCNDELRRKYDETGVWGERPQDTTMIEIMRLVTQSFMKILRDVIARGVDVKRFRFVQAIKTDLAMPIRDMVKEIESIKIEQATITEIASRFRSTSGNNELRGMTNERLNSIRIVLKSKSEDLDMQTKAVEFMDRFEYEIDPEGFAHSGTLWLPYQQQGEFRLPGQPKKLSGPK